MRLFRYEPKVGAIVNTRYNPIPWGWDSGVQPVNLGVGGGPRVSAIGEVEANCPKPWPTPYAWRLMGLYPAGQWPLFQLGWTAPTFNNQLAANPYGYNWFMPGISRRPFGG